MNIIPLFVALPLGAAFLIPLLRKRIHTFGAWSCNLVTLSLTFLSVYSVALVGGSGLVVYKVGGWAPPLGICLVMDHLAVFMLLMVNLLAFLATLYSIRYLERYTDPSKFYTLFLLMVAGMNGVIIAGDIFNLYVFLEIAAIASYSLVAFGTEREELEASFKYMVMGSIASSFILLGIAFLYSCTSTLNLADMSRVLAEKPPGRLLPLLSALFITGFGLKAALVPFHAWLPDAHPSAPAPVSAMLSGVLIKTLGVYAMVRIFFSVLGAGGIFLSILMALGAVSMLVGVFLAIGQWDFKRLLAYHSISQIGYVALGIGLGTPLGILGGLFHLFNHSMFKSLLFLNAGAVDYAAGTRDLKKMGGLREKMPVTAATSLIASLSISGMPPFNGFWSKLIIILACVELRHYGYAFCAVLASAMTLGSFLKVQKYAFFGELKESLRNIREVPFTMKVPMIVLAIVCLGGGLLLLSDFPSRVAEAVSRGREYANMVLGSVR
ncbi:MAG: monovalent cation/H+ antiporter subunit D family protein [Candidatus Aureabacteria bacterium]|nr:monovalent cation/H+ antiporter subunit D family protein [Candidatus Auribacterota bacterium]